MAIACALSVAAPSLTGKTNSNPPPRRSFQQQWRERRRRGVAARFSGKSADVDAEADSGRIEVSDTDT
jgi:hypothetical protein